LFGASNDNKPGSKPNKGFFLDLLLLLKIAGQTKRRQKDGVRKTKTNGGAKKFAANCF